jgi:hypothetical protein
VPIYEAKKEGKLHDFGETSRNPFDQGKTITGIGNKVKKCPSKANAETKRKNRTRER